MQPATCLITINLAVASIIAINGHVTSMPQSNNMEREKEVIAFEYINI